MAYLAECFNKEEVTEQKASAKDVADTRKYNKVRWKASILSRPVTSAKSGCILFKTVMLEKYTVSSLNQEGRDRPG